MLRSITKFVLALCFLLAPLIGQTKTFKNYEYDAVGGIVSIKQNDSSLAIYSFFPAAGPVDSIVTTPLGTASSSDILLIPLTGSGITCADVALTRSFLSIGKTSLISYGANQKHVVFFEAEEGDLLTLQFTEKATRPDNTYIYYQIYDFSGALILSLSSFKTESKTVHVPQIAKAGIYTLLLSAYKNNSANF